MSQWAGLSHSFGGIALNDLLKLVFARPRPDLVCQAVRVFTSSFPSHEERDYERPRVASR